MYVQHGWRCGFKELRTWRNNLKERERSRIKHRCGGNRDLEGDWRDIYDLEEGENEECISYLLLCETTINVETKNKHIHSHCFCGSGIWEWLSESSVSGSLPRLQSRSWSGLGPHLRLQWGKIHFHTPLLLAEFRFLWMIRLRVLFPCWLSAVSWRLPQVSCLVGLSMWWVIPSAKKGESQ